MVVACEVCDDSSFCPDDESSMCTKVDQNVCMEELGSQPPPHIFRGHRSPIRHQLCYDPIEDNTSPPTRNVGFLRDESLNYSSLYIGGWIRGAWGSWERRVRSSTIRETSANRRKSSFEVLAKVINT